MSFFLINDKSSYNNKYRSGIIDELSARNINVVSYGFFDSFMDFLKVAFFLLFSGKAYLSSNMKCNLLCLIVFWSKGTIIVNGLGRYKYNFYFRWIFSCLLFINRKRKKIVFQNYSDYRFFKLKLKLKFFWIPGSGGSVRKVGFSDDILIISRDDKLLSVYNSIFDFSKIVKNDSNILFIGCNGKAVDKCFEDDRLIGLGIVPQCELFTKSHKFFQPRGYGEGVPHSLVDAICSGMEIYLSKKDFISFGLYCLGFRFELLSNGIGKLSYSYGQSNMLLQKKISCDYIELALGHRNLNSNINQINNYNG
ncbi:hypothetical protein NDJ08_20755 [Vibrio alginolyticus]|uniref:hypothetical protein n=1 Tax=Vibrio alginolyticus TaxID=663 RepID=UPI00215BA9F6|nr:hypothetical protein [Vibrio alginolyticus]MCR9519995.1 hypothetical protein [Vibrio alginolyticus]MCS0169016.1 hypothetical protein [Vibrio alginolyticus]